MIRPHRTLPRSFNPAALLRLGLASLLALVFSGCATTWSDTQKAKLTSVAVAQPTVAKDAYQKPDATVSPGMANTIPQITGGGLIPSLVGSVIDATVTAKQQKKFESTNAQYFDGLAKLMGTPPAPQVEETLKAALAEHPFFGSRLAEKSKVEFTTEVLHYGLEKSPYSQGDDIKLRVRIIAKVTLKLGDGDSLWTTLITGTANTAKRAPEILEDPSFVSTGVQEAAKNLCEQVVVQLDQKLEGRKPVIVRQS